MLFHELQTSSLSQVYVLSGTPQELGKVEKELGFK